MIYCIETKAFSNRIDRANAAADAAQMTREIMAGKMPEALNINTVGPVPVLPPDAPPPPPSAPDPEPGPDRFTDAPCAICMAPVGMPMLSTGDDAPLITVCRHVFHRGCIRNLQSDQHPLDFTCPTCDTYIGPMEHPLAPREEEDPDTSTMEKALPVCQERLLAALGCIYQARMAAIGGDASVEAEFKFIAEVLTQATSPTHKVMYDSLMHDACACCVQAYAPNDAHDAFDMIQAVRNGQRAELSREERAGVTDKIASAIVRNQSAIAVLVLFVLMLDPAQPLFTRKEDYDRSPWKPFVEQWRDAAIRNSMSDLDRSR